MELIEPNSGQICTIITYLLNVNTEKILKRHAFDIEHNFMDKKILIIEDDNNISDLIKLHLEDINIQTHCIFNGAHAWTHFQNNHYDLVILDIMLPGMDGLELCKRIRDSESSYTPVLMLTSRSSETDRVLGLELGADDYLTKPFSLIELVARVKALLRRVDAIKTMPVEENQLHFDGLSIIPDSRQVLRDNINLELTAKEFDLLFYFANHPKQVFSRIQLLDNIWGYSHEGYEHTVNSHINRLRGKLEPDPRNPRFIKTIWGVGYQFIAPCSIAS